MLSTGRYINIFFTLAEFIAEDPYKASNILICQKNQDPGLHTVPVPAK
jgi:hypothetical protein